jgi:hypothetical protein
MSVSGIFSSGLSNNQISSQYRLTNQEFQQLGNDLAAGNLSSAQSDFAVLEQAFTGTSSAATSSASSSSSATSTSPLAQAFQQLSSDLQSGNLSAAQKDYTTIQKDVQSHGARSHFRHHVGSFPTMSTGDASSSTTGTAVQQAYAMLSEQLQQLSLGDEAAGTVAGTMTNPISVLA